MGRTSINRVLSLIAAILFSVLLSACLGNIFHRPCNVPEGLNEQELIGEWRISYSAEPYVVSDPIEGSLVATRTVPYLVVPNSTPMPLSECALLLIGYNGNIENQDVAWERCSKLRGEDYLMEGKERVVLYEDGTYQQIFSSDAYSYTSPLQSWDLITDTPDGPKLRMNGMKYFAEGIAQANSSIQMILKPQTVDLLRIQEYVESTKPRPDGLGGGVIYPDFGFIYLYPRMCKDELSLVQMGWRVGDPDNLVTSNPVFRKRQ